MALLTKSSMNAPDMVQVCFACVCVTADKIVTVTRTVTVTDWLPVCRMPPAKRQNFRGPKSVASKAKVVLKQSVLSAAFTLVAKLPDALPSPAPTHPKPVYKPHPLGRPKHVGDNVILLEVNAAVHRIIDIIVVNHEKQTIVMETECRTALNSIIDQLILLNTSNLFVELKSVRQQYTSATKRKVCELVAATCSSQGISERAAIKQLNVVPGYGRVSGGTLRVWKRVGPLNKRGRKTSPVFEAHIIGQLIYTRIENIDGVDQAVVQANVAHSWHVIKLAAEQVQKWPQFLDDQVALFELWARFRMLGVMSKINEQLSKIELETLYTIKGAVR